MNPALAIALIQAVPTIASEVMAWFLRVQEARRVYAMPEGPEKEAEIQRVLTELSTQTDELQGAINVLQRAIDDKRV